jgi:hypothetical protein
MAEKAEPQDLLSGDVLLLASGSWNTGGIDGQLNPHMWALLQDKAKMLDLAANRVRASGSGTTARVIWNTMLRPMMAG